MKAFGSKPKYQFRKEGSFGRFSTGESFPIEYIQTTFLPHELNKLSLAREIKPDEIDFNLLMQRDIYEDRARQELAAYLYPRKKTKIQIKSQVIFFPPLLVAIVGTEHKTIQSYYPNMEHRQVNLGDIQCHEREWNNLFKLTHMLDEGSDSYELSLPSGENLSVAQNPVKLEIKLSEEHEPGAKLVVIDGQHRLFALREVYDHDPEILKDLVVPVCILFSPNSTPFFVSEGKKSHIAVPTIPEVFRHLFVDVNSTMELVGGHFNILLSDTNVSSLSIRSFCDSILKDPELGQDALALIEWNTRQKKDSTIVKKEYSITSIGLIDKALNDGPGRREILFKYLLQINETIKQSLNPDGSEEIPEVEWEKFTLSQKEILERQISLHLAPCMKKIFFEIGAFKSILANAKKEFSILEEKGKTADHGSREARKVLSAIKEYNPIKLGDDDALGEYDKFEAKISEWKRTNVFPQITHALFQRAMFFAWESILVRALKYAEPVNATSGFVVLMDMALSNKGELLSIERKYTQHTIWQDSNIRVREETKKQMSRLILALLGNKTCAEKVASAMNLSADDLAPMISKLENDGQDQAIQFFSKYIEDRTSAFRNSYREYAWLDQDKVRELEDAQKEEEEKLQKLKTGEITNDDLVRPFEQLVKKYVQSDIALAKKELRETLKYDIQIISIELDDEIDGQ